MPPALADFLGGFGGDEARGRVNKWRGAPRGICRRAITSISAPAFRPWPRAARGRGREVIFHSENGIPGMGPKPEPGKEDPFMVDAGKNLTMLVAGGCFVHHADAFLMIRGGHLAVSLLGAFEVSGKGDLANWTIEDRHSRPASAERWIWRSAPGRSVSLWITPARRASRAS
jgi:hypothetical protein